MKKDRFKFLCMETEAGRDAFVQHSSSNEEGLVRGCDLRGGMMLVQTADDRPRRWEFDECDDLPRPKSGPMS